ncbi:MAG: ribosome recycling factor [Kiritimatiellae bacterium]|nr:ribosome recycling factor [Kiritimatiellia bacterium]
MAHPALDTAKEKMDGALRSLNQQLDGIRTGKASPALVENITALYYGAPTRIRELGNIATPEPRLITITPYDPSVVNEICKAILAANIGVTPVSDGRKVRVPIPELSEERRKEMAKVAAKMAEDARIAVRNVRREANDEAKKLQKDGKLTEDDRDRLLEDIQKATDAAIGKIDAAAKAKEAEVMAV